MAIYQKYNIDASDYRVATDQRLTELMKYLKQG
jgi:hypothetical protein